MRSFSCVLIIIDDKLHERFRPCRIGNETFVDSVGTIIWLSDGIDIDDDPSPSR